MLVFEEREKTFQNSTVLALLPSDEIHDCVLFLFLFFFSFASAHVDAYNAKVVL